MSTGQMSTGHAAGQGSPGLGDLAADYDAVLRQYVSRPDESALLGAYEIGRTALNGGLGVLDMAHVHSRVVSSLVARPPAADRGISWPEAAEKLFVEALSPFEMAHRGFRDANAVLRRLNELLEAQSSRIACVLHDEAAQLLIPVHLGLADVKRRVPAEVGPEIDRLRGILGTIEERLRGLSHELRPPLLDQIGLESALELLCAGVSKRWDIPVDFHADLGARMPATVETTLYRVVQEALTNVVKHSGATRAAVSLVRRPHAIGCSVADDGRGVGESGPGAAGLGLRTLRERVAALGGVVRLGPSDGRGTSLTVDIPLED